MCCSFLAWLFAKDFSKHTPLLLRFYDIWTSEYTSLKNMWHWWCFLAGGGCLCCSGHWIRWTLRASYQCCRRIWKVRIEENSIDDILNNLQFWYESSFSRRSVKFSWWIYYICLAYLLNQITRRGNKFPLTFFFFNGSINLHCIEWLRAGIIRLFCKELNNRYLRLCGPYSLCCNCWSLPL